MKSMCDMELSELEVLVGKVRRGELTPAEFRSVSVHYGVYTQRQGDRYFVRLRVSNGVITPEQVDALAKVLIQDGIEKCQLTTRQGIEVHDLAGDQIMPLLRVLAKAGLSSHETGGSSIRSVMVCPHAGVGMEEPFDVTEYAAWVTDLFVRHPDFQRLPRKMKIGFSCCSGDCARSTLQDIGFQARLSGEGSRGFRVLVGGGTGALPRLGQELLAFIPAAELAGFTEAFLRMFDRLGNRNNRNHARVKFLVQDLGLDRLREEVFQEWDALREKVYPRHQAVTSGTARTGASSSGMWRVPIGPDGITGQQLLALANVARRFELALRTTADQAFQLSDVQEQDRTEIHQALESAGLVKPPAATHLVTCPGSSACANAYTNAPALARALTAQLANVNVGQEFAAGLRLRISGCTNGCALHAIADIGLEGLARRNGEEWQPAYRLRVGGRESETSPRFGTDLGIIPARRVPGLVAELVSCYSMKRKGAETFGDVIQRIGSDEASAIAKKYQSPVVEKELAIDWGETRAFQPPPRLAGAGAC